MSRRPLGRSLDLKRLISEGYDVDIVDGYLLVRGFPHVTAKGAVSRGTLATTLMLADDVTSTPDTHVAYFAGEYPCDEHGRPIEAIRHGGAAIKLSDGTILNYSFSGKPAQPFADYYEKVAAYERILCGPARVLEPKATPKTFPMVAPTDDNSVFNYEDTATARAHTGAINGKLAGRNVAIIGVGGTGSYVLDYVAKTPVKEVHLFDDKTFLQHNSFRSPGAASGAELAEKIKKVSWYTRIYSKLRKGIVEHPYRVDATNVEELRSFDFVFLCVDRGTTRRFIAGKLTEMNIKFVDVGMGIYAQDEALGGIVRTTASTPARRDHFQGRASFGDDEDVDEYNTNIQVVELNALNAAMAVIKWKKLCGFYHDLEREHHSTYSIGVNAITNLDQE